MTEPQVQLDLSPDERGRYARHLTLPELGIEGQKRLKASSVLCVGAGGLGSPLLLYLAAAGIGRIAIVDDDCVEVSNLQRQVIHGEGTVGQPKAQSARRRMLDLNPHCQVEEHRCRITAANALDLIADHDLVVDGSDNFPTRYLISDACALLNKPWVYGSVQRFEGQVSVFNRGPASPDYRDLVPEPPPPDLVPSCADGGVMGVMPGLIGLIQATEVIKVLAEIGDPLDGRLLLVDGLSMRFRELRLQRRPARTSITGLVDYQAFCNAAETKRGEESTAVNSISVRELSALMAQGSEWVLIDVRNPAEADVAVIEGAQLVPLAKIENGEGVETVRSLADTRPIYVHCKMGGRSARAVELLAQHGIDATNVTGGINAWSQEVDASVPVY
ncbi:molybdopterin-synthase adenylyltransferase MoeB [Synechococcus sp. NOUM97013]|uniref:molybdopterin-synthase adenylyltransferase MoeB n=1 Tax=Synechococcus sp. NOUM97013 TaxID=1442555 RepID=UPI001644E7E2|nr:molybdopterin-synthase adenylyltransferase MoeB [Synechococcus sp. NOUM97013]QNI72565.1 molybdopterin biosynthesis protein MoeB [Synechococcus sp. NOUM97013]